MKMTGHAIDTVTLQIDKETAREAVEKQLRDFAKAAKEAAELFAQGVPHAAYSKFPWRSPAGANLEAFCDVFAPNNS